MKKFKQKILSIILVIGMLISSTDLQVFAKENAGECCLYGTVYDMGYDREIMAVLSNINLTVTATDREGNKFSTKSSKGEYAINLEQGKNYTITFTAVYSLKSLKYSFEKVFSTEKKEVNIVLKTNRVSGFGQSTEKKQIPENSLVFTDSWKTPIDDKGIVADGDGTKEENKEDKKEEDKKEEEKEEETDLSKEKLYFEQEKYYIRTNKSQQVKLFNKDGQMQKLEGLTFSVSDSKIAKVSEKGTITGIAKGDTKLQVHDAKHPQIVLGESEINVRSGFDYKVDGLTLKNAEQSFYYNHSVSDIQRNAVRDPKSGRVKNLEEHHSIEYYQNHYGLAGGTVSTNTGYAIPYARYKEVDSTFTKVEYNPEIWEGNCFGMSMVASLLYLGILPDSNLPSNDGHNVNENSCFGTLAMGNTSYPANDYNVTKNDKENYSDFTKLIERYQIWQNTDMGELWHKENEIKLSEVLENWNNQKVAYMISLRWDEVDEDSKSKKNVGHSVIINTNDDYISKKQAGEEIIYIPIYDPNFPIYSKQDGKTFDSAKYPNQQNVRMLKLIRGETDKYIYVGATNGNQKVKENVCTEVKFYKITEEFINDSFLNNHFSKDRNRILKVIRIFGNFIVKNIYNEIVFDSSDGKFKFNTDDLYVGWETSGAAGNGIFLICDNLDNYIIESEEAGNIEISNGNYKNIIDSTGGVVVKSDNGKIEVEAKDDSTINILSKSYKSNTEYTCVTSEGYVEKGNTVTATITPEGQYSLASTDKTDMDIQLCTQSIEEPLSSKMTVTQKEAPVDIVEYVKDNPVTENSDLEGETNTGGTNQNMVVDKPTAPENENSETGTKEEKVTSKPSKVKMTSVKNKKKNKIVVKWKRNKKVSGYQIQYSTSSKFKGKTTKKVLIKKNAITTKTLSKLKARKKYYVRMRAYKNVKKGGKTIKVYSAWSKAKKITVKK